VVSGLEDRAGEAAVVGDGGGVERREGVWGLSGEGGDDGTALLLRVEAQIIQLLLSINEKAFLAVIHTLRDGVSVHPF
jgi:hypothetical protein